MSVDKNPIKIHFYNPPKYKTNIYEMGFSQKMIIYHSTRIAKGHLKYAHDYSAAAANPSEVL